MAKAKAKKKVEVDPEVKKPVVDRWDSPIALQYLGRSVVVDPKKFLFALTEDNLRRGLATYDRDRTWLQTLAMHARRRLDEEIQHQKVRIAMYELAIKASGTIPVDKLVSDFPAAYIQDISGVAKLTEAMVKNAVQSLQVVHDSNVELAERRELADRLQSLSASMNDRHRTLERMCWMCERHHIGS